MVTAAAVTDLRHRRIPNALTFPSIVLGLLLLAADSTPSQYGRAVGVTAIVFVVGLVLYLLGAFGGGDAKLLTAVAAIGGPKFFTEFLVWICIVGVIASLLVLTSDRALIPFGKNLARAAVNVLRYGAPMEPVIDRAGHQIAYALIIAGGAYLTIAASFLDVRFF